MDQVEVTIEIELEDGVHEVKLIGSQAGIDATVAALEGDTEAVEAIEVTEESATEEAEPEADGEEEAE